MRTVAHISDLHFGAETPTVADALVRELHDVEPSLVVISGDFTQRARRAQFAAARAYLQRLPAPRLCVPGNHDVPLYDVVRRAFFPLQRYRAFIDREVNPVYRDDQLLVVGLNSARSATWKNGRISAEQMEKLERHLDGARHQAKVVVTHHPFLPPPDDVGIELVGRAARTVEVLDRCGVDLLLAGHLHRGYAGDIRTQYPAARRAIVSAQAGTAISHRLRGSDVNNYNLIRLSPDRMEIEVRAWNGTRFAPLRVSPFHRMADGWHGVT